MYQYFDEEMWAEHPEFKTEISSHGRVKQRTNQFGRSVRISLGAKIRRAGYKESFEYATKVIHRISGKKHQKRVHQLVLEAFGSFKEGDRICVDHIDGDPENNHVLNLRWSSYLENNRNRNGKFK